jgi:hypothetical protein
MVDVSRLPENAFGAVPTPAIVAPIEFTLRLDDFAALGGHVGHMRPAQSLAADYGQLVRPDEANPWPLDRGPARGRGAKGGG